MKCPTLFSLFLLVCVLQSTSVYTQINLVPNTSLDTFTMCPINFSQISYAFPWTDAGGGSTDYFHTCSSVAPVPFVYLNYAHNSHSGAGMAGIWMQQANYREYVQVRLLDTLEAGISYWVEFYVFLCHGTAYGVNNVGAHLSSSALQQPANGVPITTVTPQILLPGNPVITDTMQWTRVSACYLATGGELFITIGNFYDDANTDTAATLGNYQGAYYFIDDVGITEVDTLGYSEFESDAVVTFPNPANELIQFQFAESNQNRPYVIYNSAGQEVQSGFFSGTILQISTAEFPDGLYLFSCLDGKNVVKEQFLISH